MDWTLERVNGPRNFIVLDKSERSYPCGRNVNNKIVCPSLVVSRRHCIFVRADDVISVIDLGSSNGVYRNGQLLEPNVLVELQENDSIGIGSSDEYRDNEPMFVYKLHKGNLNSRNLEEFDDLLTQKSSVVDNTNGKSKASSISVPGSNGRRSTLKRNLPDEIEENRETPVVPQKVSKLSNGLNKISDDKDDVREADSQPMFSPKDDQPLEVEEIEEIWSTLSPQKISNEKRSGFDNKNGVTKVLDEKKVGKIAVDLNGSNQPSLSFENEKFKKPWKKVELLNGEKELQTPASTTSSSSVNLNLAKENEAQVNKQGQETEKDAAFEVNEIIVSPTVQKPERFNSGVENSLKSIRFSLDSTPLATRLTVDILPANNTDQCAKENEDEEKNPKHKKRRDRYVNKSSKRREVPKTSSPKVSTPEGDKIESRLSFSDKEPVATSSPFKLKLIKQEPMTSFSIFDTVDLSDDNEDIFPSSQLFDSTSEGVGSFKVEDRSLSPNAENLFENDEDEEESKVFFTQVDPAIEESEEIITLSDSDDEENPWLDRLSESQRIKEEKPEIGDKNEVEEVDGAMFEMDFVDELLNLKQDLSVKAEKDELDIQVPGVEVESDSPKSDSKKIIKPSRSMTVSEIEKDINYEDSDDSSPRSSPSRERVQKSQEKSAEEPTQVKQTTAGKGPKIIEPLHLPARKRLSLRDSLSSSIDGDTLASPSTSKGRVRVGDCSVAVPKLPTNLTTKQKRQLQIEDRIKQKKYEEEQRIRRIKNKWAQSVPLPLGKRKSPSISKKQKLKIVNERKEKLKALATKQKAEAVTPSVERVAVKAKAKVSTKNRGDFLINEQVVKQVKDPDRELGEASERKKESKSSSCSSKSSEKGTESISSKKVAKVPKKVAASDDREEAKLKKDKKRTERRSRSVEKSHRESSAVATTSNTADKGIAESLKDLSLTQKENRVPNSLDRQKKEEGEEKSEKKRDKKNKKKVSFSENLVTVRVFEINENNTMKKCTGKDALIPKDKMAGARRKENKSQHPKLEEFLMHIFKWNPSWLEEQKHLKTEPPIVNNESLVPLLTNYKSYKDYYQVLMPVLLLELWHGITKEFESIDKNKRRQTVFCSIVNNSVTFQPIPSTNTTLTTMLLEVLASEDDIRKQIHPVYGDLVFLELCYRNEEGKQNFLKVFAYVTQLHRTVITQNTFFNRDLINYTKNPSRVLTYAVLTRPLKVQLCINRVLRLRCVTYLRSNMRMVQALQSLPSSPLLNLIINPKVEEYKFSSPTKQCSLVTRDKLNHKQTEAVFKTTEAIVRKEPKICLVQGPPGTGKSEVIVNMVMQILYADNRYKNRETGLRILLCAPSNAAIDEIVLRLLDRRAKLTNDRFKMVRVGLLAPMHPRVREISVEELAKRDVKRTINSYQSCGQSMNSVEEEKRFLEARINALKSKLASSQQKDENQIQYTNMKLLEVKTRYELINTWTQSNGNNVNPRDLVKIQRGAETKILIGADIIACTLSSCYTNIMESAFGGAQKSISVCIVDEATQSCEAETLIPLMLGVNTLVLVGDPAQLPATVISQRAKTLGLDQSLFSRAQRAFEGVKNSPVIMLDVQYRMDGRISYWPNKYFYGGKLRNGVTREQPLLPFHPYRVVNVNSSQNNDKFSNSQEAEFVANLIYSMINYMDLKKIPHSISIGVITPYRNQQILVEAKIKQRVSSILESLKIKVTTEVNTVDSFQGHERDIVIMSCVRTNGIGFLSDPQRLCVALTRAKHCLVLCGNFATFQRDAMWRALLTDAQSRNSYIDMKSNLNPNEIVSKLVR